MALLWAETCRQFKITTSKKLSCVLTHLKPSLYCITKHNGDDAFKEGKPMTEKKQS